ncbi:hypothetical protein [Pedobacter antarcticus]|uniref:hypothetical protein n=1 Tax=Pedobacter antarcticus TaxID=34086 RepID=UPI001C5A2541|nr:hypothetical protein [Pedobacter antarcticus]
MIKKILWILAFPFLLSCAKSVNSDVEVYANDFENGNLTGITKGEIGTFNGSKVLGQFNNGGFDLALNDLPAHEMVEVSFDLYIHDNWDGNAQFADNVIGPDIWRMRVDDQTYINTTFSNAACTPGFICPPQSYPADYPNNNQNPRVGAEKTKLPGVCAQRTSPTGTSLYKIKKRIAHSSANLLIQCDDKLMQKNVADPKCDESWSVDNIKVRVINLK